MYSVACVLRSRAWGGAGGGGGVWGTAGGHIWIPATSMQLVVEELDEGCWTGCLRFSLKEAPSKLL